MAWTSDATEPLNNVKDYMEKAQKLVEQKNWQWAASYLESAVEELQMAQGACEYQMDLEREAGTFEHKDEPEWEEEV